jgi:hypothetical protein
VSTTAIHYVNRSANKLADVLQSQGVTYSELVALSRIEWELAASIAGLAHLTQGIQDEIATIVKWREFCDFKLPIEPMALIAKAALKDYAPEQVEVADQTYTLSDGRTAYEVLIHPFDPDSAYDIVLYDTLIEAECYFATVVDGVVYSNEEFDALRQEYDDEYLAEMQASQAAQS